VELHRGLFRPHVLNKQSPSMLMNEADAESA